MIMGQSIEEKLEVIKHWLRGGDIEIKPRALDCWVTPNRLPNLEELQRNEVRIVKKKEKRYQIIFQESPGDIFEITRSKYPDVSAFDDCYFAKLIEESEEEFDVE
jgi:hypothetical protein